MRKDRETPEKANTPKSNIIREEQKTIKLIPASLYCHHIGLLRRKKTDKSI